MQSFVEEENQKAISRWVYTQKRVLELGFFQSHLQEGFFLYYIKVTDSVFWGKRDREEEIPEEEKKFD